MKLFNLLILATAILMTFTSCEDDDSNDNELTITFKAMYNGEDLQMRKTYDYDEGNGSTVQFDRIRYFISDVTLIGDDTELIKDVHMFNYDDFFSQEENVGKGLSITLNDVPRGQQTFRFGYGVSKDLNATEPADYPIGHPLAEGDDYWKPWESYIFSKHEGKYYAPMTSDTAVGFLFHTGSDVCYSEISTQVNLDQSSEEIIIEVDFYDVFKEEDGSLYHIPDEAQLHRLNQQDLLNFVCSNIVFATKVYQKGQ